eukprot:CAMPEP_0174229176 /NCGR_PEP_ID=MMETSP0417-20130205/227_1 /TAXON_ID=242541 /ORGANISM="Mayorella sp, Strain BSH-02190019" /LENGTH=118 /DNA_ID=CAMNT_0015306699 /DNA_START=310 /DNA_END=663 /DNA_ORIENTATION=+
MGACFGKEPEPEPEPSPPKRRRKKKPKFEVVYVETYADIQERRAKAAGDPFAMLANAGVALPPEMQGAGGVTDEKVEKAAVDAVEPKAAAAAAAAAGEESEELSSESSGLSESESEVS